MKTPRSRARRTQGAVAAACEFCLRVTESQDDLCLACKRRFVRIKDNIGSPTDQLIARAMGMNTAKQREKVIFNHGHQSSRPSSRPKTIAIVTISTNKHALGQRKGQR